AAARSRAISSRVSRRRTTTSSARAPVSTALPSTTAMRSRLALARWRRSAWRSWFESTGGDMTVVRLTVPSNEAQWVPWVPGIERAPGRREDGSGHRLSVELVALRAPRVPTSAALPREQVDPPHGRAQVLDHRVELVGLPGVLAVRRLEERRLGSQAD